MRLQTRVKTKHVLISQSRGSGHYYRASEHTIEMLVVIYFYFSQSGQAIYSTTVPDTITTWTGEVLALSPATGLGISPLASLTVKKLLFVSLTLPYSINWGETVTLVPLVFNFQSTFRAVHINISVILDDELSFVEQPPDSIVVSITLCQ